MIGHVLRSSAVLAAALALAGCPSSDSSRREVSQPPALFLPSPPPDTSAAGGEPIDGSAPELKILVVADPAVSVGLPADWVTVDLTSPDFEADLARSVDANPQLAELLDSQSREIRAIGGLAISVDTTADAYVANASLVFTPDTAVDPEEIELGLQVIGATDVTVVRVPASGGDTFRADGVAPLDPDRPGGSAIAVTQLQMTYDDGVVVLTLSAEADAGYASLFDAIVASVELR